MDRNEKNVSYWDETYHGKTESTHNTTKNITERREQNQDTLIEFDIDHPLKKAAQKDVGDETETVWR